MRFEEGRAVISMILFKGTTINDLGGGQRKSREKNFEGHSPGKKILKALLQGKNYRYFPPRKKNFKHFLDWVFQSHPLEKKFQEALSEKNKFKRGKKKFKRPSQRKKNLKRLP